MFSSYYEWEARMRQREGHGAALVGREPLRLGNAIKIQLNKRLARAKGRRIERATKRVP